VHAIAAGFNQDNGTGRVVSTSGVGLPDAGAHMQAWLAKLPQEFQNQLKYNRRWRAGHRGTDNASFDCYGAPVFGLGATGWDYGSYTHHTNRDSFDKIVFDDLKGNATIVAMLAYLASEDPRSSRVSAPISRRMVAVVAAAAAGAVHRPDAVRSTWAMAAAAPAVDAAVQSLMKRLGADLREGATFLQRHVARDCTVQATVAGGESIWKNTFHSGRHPVSRLHART